MSFSNKMISLKNRLMKSFPFPGRTVRETIVNYSKYCNLVRSLKMKAEQLAFTERDPRVNLLTPQGLKNLYFLQFILSGDAIEDTANGRLISQSDINSQVSDEFERNDAHANFNEALTAQQDLLHKKIFYIEQELELPEFNFENQSFEFDVPGLISNRSIALHDIQFLWDLNLTEFHPRFLFSFQSEDEARQWKTSASGMKLGIVFHVVTMADRITKTTMPAMLCYVVGFAFVDGSTGDIIPNMNPQVFGMPGPHEQITRNRGEIKEWVEKYQGIN